MVYDGIGRDIPRNSWRRLKNWTRPVAQPALRAELPADYGDGKPLAILRHGDGPMGTDCVTGGTPSTSCKTFNFHVFLTFRLTLSTKLSPKRFLHIFTTILNIIVGKITIKATGYGGINFPFARAKSILS